MNSGHLLGSQSNLRTSMAGELRDSKSFFKIILILSSVRLSAATTVSLPSITLSMNAPIANILDVSHLFSETKDNHGVRIIV